MSADIRDHGGNIDLAMARFGGCPAEWIDLSTGINRVPYPLPSLPPEAWTALPTRTAQSRLLQVARANYRSDAPMLAVAGAQAAIQMIPRLGKASTAKVLSPTYNEHAAALRAAGWGVEDVGSLSALEGADLAVLVNPNNPDGRTYDPAALLQLTRKVGRLVVDESFADAVPTISIASGAGMAGLVVLRSFGKFYGLAGLRLGFVLGARDDITALAEMAGPWPVSGPALAVGTLALADQAWVQATIERLRADTARIDALAAKSGWGLVGGTALFRLYDTPDAGAAQAGLARDRIWSRTFPFSSRWVRLGLPGTSAEWQRLADALQSQLPRT